MGIMADRLGPRRILFGSFIAIATGFILLSYVKSLAGFYAAYAIIGIGTSGAGSTILVIAVANWFRSKAGMAIAVATSGYMVGVLLSPLIVKIVDNYGWRDATVLFAAGVLALLLPLSFIFQHKPEQYGFSVDGIKTDILLSNQNLGKPIIAESKFTFKQAITTRAFWQISLAVVSLFLAIFAVSAIVCLT